MANDQERKQDSGSQPDISKSQSQQQPQQAAQQKPETGERSGQFETGQQGREEFAQDQSDSPDAGQQGDTLAQQRTDIEGTARETPERGEAESGFVGSKGEQDTSSELVDEEDEDFGKDGQGASERE
jgi:hypothetical protein